MKNRPVNQKNFALVPNVNKPRSVFNRSNTHKTAIDADKLIPMYYKNVLPGDSISCQHTFLIRANSPLIRAVMDNMYLNWYYFFVPYRLLWTNFVKFMGEQASPGDSISYTVPQCTSPDVAAGGIAVGSLMDYFGLPTGAMSGGGGTTGITYNNLWPRAYNKIWHDWFRSELLQNAPTLDLGDGPDTYTNYILRKKGKSHDYFTSALPFLQKGTAVPLPLGTSAPVRGMGLFDVGTAPAAKTVRESGFNNPSYTAAWGVDPAAAAGADSKAELWIQQDASNAGYPNVYADLTNATAATVNSLRQSIALQQFLENDARGGTRYVELIKQRWGVISPDFRLGRSEIVSLGRDNIKITPVTNNTANESTPAAFPWLGQIGGMVSAASMGNGFNYHATEHGVLLGLICITADITYSQGMDRHWSYRTRYDFFNPEFAHLGEQEIKNREIQTNRPDGTGATQKDGVFGYQERYAEERYSPSKLTSLMRPDAPSSLAVWNLSEQFSGLPTLGDTFIQSNAGDPIDRAISVPSEPQFLVDAYFSDRWARVMPTYGVPGLLRL